MLSYRFSTLLLCTLLLLPVSSASAAPSPTVIFSDTFDGMEKIDTVKTNASVDVTTGQIELRKAPLANAIAAAGNDIQVTDKNGVHWFTLDQAAGSMRRVDPLSPSNYNNAVGISMIPASQSGYVLEEDGTVSQFVADGYGPVRNPFMITKISNAVSITAISDSEFAASTANGVVQIFKYNDKSQKPELAYTIPTLFEIKNIQAVPGSRDFFCFTTTAVYRLVFDQATDSYSTMPVSFGHSGVLAGASSPSGDFITLLMDTISSTVIRDQMDGSMKNADALTIPLSEDPLAIARPDESTVVIAYGDGTVRTYKYDGQRNGMMEDVARRITGLEFQTEFQSPGVYQSVPFSSGPNNMFRLITDEQTDANNSILYEISTDAGATFSVFSPNVWYHLPHSTTNEQPNATTGPFVIRATLSGTSRTTPLLRSVELQAYLDDTPPSAPGTPVAESNPSYETETMIRWTPSVDEDGAGIKSYYFRYSKDDGQNWEPWIDTKSSQPDYVLTLPIETEGRYSLQVKAIDYAGNFSDLSPIGEVYINTYPIGIITTPSGSNVTVTDILLPSDGQAAGPTDKLPVQVMAGGEVLFEISTSGHVESVEVSYSDGLTQKLFPKHLVSPFQNLNVWTGYYYPSGNSTNPLSTPDGTVITFSDIKLTRDDETLHAASPLLVVSGSISGSKGFVKPVLTK